LSGKFGHDRKICSKHVTMSAGVNEFAELISALRIFSACSVLQLLALKHENSQYKIIFKMQGNISGRDFAAIGSDLLLVIHIILKLALFYIH
jgi:hypothetical protein